ncbi:TetR family transcriptional regulator C-terminal domain-containing protein [Actinomycetospora sp. NBRC 106375]|uniref:TetR/AcrR family transcriptional regulator n=1 Tax=Actinomycetospora sp. NBRC 106375 TaxID=3032207 RepID=UPI0025540E0F|nr:TetR family transcriptional regulator C-terminal domain-containing protein [Actinomycetospora sp. NBRC 106375]
MRRKIIDTSADLMYRQGVGPTTLDDVVTASGTTRGLLDRHFEDKNALVAQVVATQIRRVIDEQISDIGRLSSLDDLRTWRDRVVADTRRRHGAHGCPLGSLAMELAEHSEPSRRALAAAFEVWESEFGACLRRMRGRGLLDVDADVDALAVGLMAALQGGLIVARVTRDADDLALSLDAALSRIQAHSATS